jgi:hypothetical protein
MNPIQKTFLIKLEAGIKAAPENNIADYVQRIARNPPDLWDCLLAFMRVLAKYGIEKKSMFVCWDVASLALRRRSVLRPARIKEVKKW